MNKPIAMEFAFLFACSNSIDRDSSALAVFRLRCTQRSLN